jgi:hypothetical protein
LWHANSQKDDERRDGCNGAWYDAMRLLNLTG